MKIFRKWLPSFLVFAVLAGGNCYGKLPGKSIFNKEKQEKIDKLLVILNDEINQYDFKNQGIVVDLLKEKYISTNKTVCDTLHKIINNNFYSRCYDLDDSKLEELESFLKKIQQYEKELGTRVGFKIHITLRKIKKHKEFWGK